MCPSPAPSASVSGQLVKAGDVVRVIAPASPFDHEQFARGVAFLRERYEVRHRKDLFTADGYLAGDDPRRVAELREALEDRDASAIIAARGGYGCTRLLPHISPEEVAVSRPAKTLVGFSDVSALHALWARAGVPSLYASMVAALGNASREDRISWVTALETGATAFAGLEPWRGGQARGELIGGNLAVLAAMVGTPFAPDLKGRILLLEDVGERPYRIDRMVTTLHQAGWLGAVAGIVVGDLVRCAGPDGQSARDRLRELLAPCTIPIVAGAPIGHDVRNEPVWLGRPSVLDADAGTLTTS